MDDNAVVIADADGVIRFWSAGAQKAFGYCAAQAVGETLELIVPAEYRDAHWAGFRRAVESGAAALEGQISPFPVLRADGDIATSPGRLTLVRRAGGQVIAAMVVFD
ncbi:MAG TPA: PAS domain S-box protein [Caulobacteraceae bacterium]|jgi:PAS domain S-box-containing protein|nr:PAS domain S-box protein [Caulobacteraceae bacterium]